MADDCGCTGIRKCLLCEENKKSNNMFADKRSKTTEKYEFCILCGETFLVGQECLHRKGIDDVNVKLKGITVIQNFINEIEEETIVADIEKTVWKPSQSGRRKQVSRTQWFHRQGLRYQYLVGEGGGVSLKCSCSGGVGKCCE